MNKADMSHSLNKLLIRIKAAYRILFRKYNHWIILNLDEENFNKLLLGDPYDAKGFYHGMREHQYYSILSELGDSLDFGSKVAAKIEFDEMASKIKKKHDSR